jgi:hypothetical protein
MFLSCICVSSIELPNHLFEKCRPPNSHGEKARRFTLKSPSTCPLWRSTTAIVSCSRQPRATETGSQTVFRCNVVDNPASPALSTIRRMYLRTMFPKLRIGQYLSLFFMPLPPNHPAFPLPSTAIWLQSLYTFVIAAAPTSHIIHLNIRLLP